MPGLYIVEDYETFGIEARPAYPPRPCGVAVAIPGSAAFYMSWAHPDRANLSTRAQVRSLLTLKHKTHTPIYHNAQFDIEVAQRWLGVPIPTKYHDTQILAFLHNPHEQSLALKVLAEKYTKTKPRARDEVREWIIKNIPEARQKPSTWGAYIVYAPTPLVAKYAKSDVRMTYKLFKFLYKKVCVDMGMGAAYERELDLIKLMLKIEAKGVNVDCDRLRADIPGMEAALDAYSKKIRTRLRAPKLDFGRQGELARALDQRGLVDDWPLTAKGEDILRDCAGDALNPYQPLTYANLLKYKSADDIEKYKSTSFNKIKTAISDKYLLHLLHARGKIENALNNFATPWLAKASSNDGKMYLRWSATRNTSDHTGSQTGARSGRMQSSPNLLNVPAAPHNVPQAKRLAALYNVVPNMRNYIIPSPGNIIGIRDWSQQEMRILAHFENGPLLDAYRKDPHLDIHNYTAQMMYDIVGIDMRGKEHRTTIKGINFGRIYGMGAGKLASMLNISIDLAKQLIKAHKVALPGVTALDKKLKLNGLNGAWLETYGGRKYYAEEPRLIGGKWRRYEYKLLNYQIQPSAGDMLKIALLAADKAGIDIQLSVHDEIMIEAAQADLKAAMKELHYHMCNIPLKVNLFTTGGWSAKSWGDIDK